MSAQDKKRCSVEEVCEGLLLSNYKLCEISDRLTQSLKKGLSKQTHEKAAVRCFPTYIQDFPTGKETGRFLALDFGGTHFRVLMIVLEGKPKFDVLKETYELPPDKKQGPGAELFDYLAECVEDFCKKHNVFKDKAPVPLGFTFSFPMLQTGLNVGISTKWTKGFNATNVNGKDVVQLLHESFERRKMHKELNIVAVLNDTAGTLISCAWLHPDTRVGVIVGTGCNACYAEKIENIETAENLDSSKPLMIINCEWGNYGADGEIDDIQTEFDKDIDSRSSHQREQLYEKLISGRYLGEIARLVILKLIQKKILFGGHGYEKFSKPWQFHSEYISRIETDPEGSYENTKAVLAAMDVKEYQNQDLVDVRYVVEVVSVRSASLVGAGIATLLNKMNISPVTVGIDGSVYRQHPKFKDIMLDKIKCIVKPEIEFTIALAEDGSGLGAALVAAVSKGQVNKK